VALSFIFEKLKSIYEVNLIKCSSGEDAVEQFKKFYEKNKYQRIHLMIVDYFMGSFNGDEVIT
jgi:hypothetical protein